MARRIRIVPLVVAPIALALAVGAVWFRDRTFQDITFDTASMAPTYASGARVVVQRVDPASIVNGDVIVFDGSSSPGPRAYRVLGLPGETVAVREGHVTRNGAPVEESYTSFDLGGGPDFGPLETPAATLFALGDNRGNARDSRIIGPISFGAIRGKVVERTTERHLFLGLAIALATLAAVSLALAFRPRKSADQGPASSGAPAQG